MMRTDVVRPEQKRSIIPQRGNPTERELPRMRGVRELRSFASGLEQTLRDDVGGFIAQSDNLEDSVRSEALDVSSSLHLYEEVLDRLNTNKDQLQALVDDAHVSAEAIMGDAKALEIAKEKLQQYLRARLDVIDQAIKALPTDQQGTLDGIENVVRDLTYDPDEIGALLAPLIDQKKEIQSNLLDDVIDKFSPAVRLGVLAGMAMQDDVVIDNMLRLDIPASQMREYLIDVAMDDLEAFYKYRHVFDDVGVGMTDILRDLAVHQPERMSNALQKIYFDNFDSEERKRIQDIVFVAQQNADERRLAKEKRRQEIWKQMDALQDPGFEKHEAGSIVERAKGIGEKIGNILKGMYPEHTELIGIQVQKERQLQEAVVVRSVQIMGSANGPMAWHFEEGGAAVFKARRNEQPGLRDGIRAGTYAAREWLVFQIDRALQLYMVPVTVLRQGSEGYGSVQEWKNHTSKTAAELGKKKWRGLARSEELERVGFLDSLTVNSDRHEGNFLIDELGKVHAIDNGLTFSTLQTGSDCLRCRPLDIVYGRVISSDIRNRIQCFVEHTELQQTLQEAFELALGENGSQAFQQFSQKLSLFVTGSKLPKSEW